MNFGLITSYIIGGIILLAILSMNMSVSNSSIELTVRQMNQKKISGVSDMLSHDFDKMGYNLRNKTDSIFLAAEGKKVEFLSNIDESSDESVEKITWKLIKDGAHEITSTENPNDYELIRTVREADTGSLIEETPIRLGITDFNISYYNTHGASISDDSLNTPLSDSQMKEVKQLYVKINLQSSEKTFDNADSDGRYVLSIWEKRFSPLNLE